MTIDEANKQFNAGNMQQAAQLYEQILATEPTHHLALHNLAVIAFEFDRADVAIDLFIKSIAAKPDYIKAYLSLAKVFERKSQYTEAQHILETALLIEAKNYQLKYQLAYIFYKKELLAESEQICKEITEADKKNDDAHNLLGIIYQEQGLFDLACKQYRKAIRINKSKYDSYYYLSQIKKFKKNDPDINELKQIALKDKATSDPNYHKILFALGKAHHDINDYETAFNFFQKANRNRREHSPYNREASENLLEQLANVFDDQAIKNNAGFGSNDTTPIFIVGMPRSGTSLLEQIISSHSQVEAVGESLKLSELASSTVNSDKPYPESLLFDDKDAFLKYGTDYVSAMKAKYPEARYIIDKMPTNFTLLGFIHLILPKAKIIHCVRDPIATCFSCFRTGFSTEQLYTNDLEDLGHYYNHYQQLMTHWKKVLPDKILEVKYEDLVEDMNTSLATIFDYLALTPEENCLKFFEQDSVVKTASTWQVRQPVYSSSLSSWKKYQSQLKPLIEQLGKV